MRTLSSACAAVVLSLVVGPPSTNAASGALSAQVQAERNVSPSLNAKPSESTRQRLQLTSGQACENLSGPLVCCNRISGAERQPATLPCRGGAKRLLKGQWGDRKRGRSLPATPGQLTAVQRAIAGNLLSWATVVGGTLAWSHTRPESKKGV